MSFTPNWQQLGLADKNECWKRIFKALKDKEDAILTTTIKTYDEEGREIQEARFMFAGATFNMRRKYKKKK